MFETGAIVQPQKLCNHLSQDVDRIYNAELTSISGNAGVWNAHFADGRTFEAEHIVLCAGADLPPLLKIIGHDLGVCQVTSGQLVFTKNNHTAFRWL